MTTSRPRPSTRPSAGPKPGSIRPDSSIGTRTGRPWTRESSKSSAPAPGAMWTIPVPRRARPRPRGSRDGRCRSAPAASSNGPSYSSPTSSSPRARAVVLLARSLRQPPIAVAQPVFGVGLDRGGDVRGQRPRRRRPHDERLALASLQREPDVERGMLELLVLAGRSARAARARSRSGGTTRVARWPL